jgi:Ras family protein A
MANKVERKLVVIGDGACGKTCLLIKKKDGKMPDSYVPTVFENYVVEIPVKEKVYEVSLWDTAGQEDYAHIRPLSYEGVQVILLCVGLDSIDSLDNVEAKWLPEIQQHCKDVPFIIVGTKSDLKAEGKAVVTEAQLKALVDKCGKMCQGYRQCSALSGEGVNELFEYSCIVSKDSVSGGGGCCVIS